MLKEKAECVKVVVRARPLSKGEITEGKNSVVTVDPSKGGIYIANPLNPKEVKSFFFDHSYDDTLSQETIFNETAKPIIDSVMQGYNGTIFAYGQTGTGKTFTMEGDLHSNQHKGIIPRTIEQIFNSIKESPNQQFLVQVSFVEIYNEEVRDLLNKNVKTKLDVRERDGGFYVQDCKIIKVENAKETLDYMFTGRDNRAKGATKMNKDSSRSHSIFTIIVENSSVEGGETKYKMGKLNLVDLAGSERQSKTEATGERLKEATKINLSLTVLGNVICALVNPKQSHIPYRESKLTMLLCDSLGGNTKTVMIANVGPADYNYEETLNTLWYANRAKNIKNKPKINEDPKDAMLRQYQEEIEKLRLQLQGFGGALPGAIGSKQVEEKVVFVEDDSRLKAIEENMEKEKEDYKVNAEKEIQKIKLQKNLAEEEKQRLIDSINKKSEDQRRIKDEQKKILKKYREMEKKLLTGKDVDKKVKEQEAKLAESRKILEEKRREEQRLQYELEIKKKNNIEIKQKYENNQAMLDDLNEKISLLRTKIEDSKRENKETQDGYNQEISNLMDAIKGMEIEMKKKDFIISNFVTPDEKEKLTKCIEYNEKEQSYVINNQLAIINNYKMNRDPLKKMKKNKIDAFNNMPSIFKYESSQQDEQIIHLQIDLPEKLVENFTGQKNDLINKEIEHVLKDDDTDLIYFDKELNLFDNNISNSSFISTTSSKSDNANTSTTSTTNTRVSTSTSKEPARKRPGSSMKKN